MPGLTTSGTILGLAAAIAGAFWLATSRRAETRPLLAWLVATAPSAVILLSFAADSSLQRWFTGWVPLLIIGFFALAYLLVATSRRRADRTATPLSVGGTLGLFSVVGTLYTLGCLVQVRLRLQKDPNAHPSEGVTDETIKEFVLSQAVLPLGILALGVAFQLTWPHLRGPWQRLLGLGERLHLGFPRFSRMVPGDRLPSRPGRRPSVPLTGLVVSTLGVLAFALLPMWYAPTNGARLYAFNGLLAVNEWVRPLWTILVASTLASLFYEVGPRPWRSTRGRGGWLAGLLAVQVLGMAVIGFVRSDFGSLIPLMAMSVAMAIPAGRWNRDRFLVAIGERPSGIATTQGWRIFGAAVVGAALILVVAFFTMPSLKARFEPWQDPWQFPWSAECTSVEKPPSWIRPADGDPGLVPAGYELCRTTQADALESGKAQVARALTVIDGGGLWGRGLSDSEARIVPVLESDFVLAAVWSKLGGVVVLLATLAAIAACLLVIRSLSPVPVGVVPGSPLSVVQLYRYGIGTGIASHAVFLLLSTTNQLPFSGIPFPFLARAGQATGALVLGLVTAIVMTSHLPGTHPPLPARDLRRPKADPSRALPLMLTVLVCVWGLVAGLCLPFASLKQWNLNAGLAHPGVQTVLRSRNSQVRLSIGGDAAYRQDRVSGAWTVAGSAAPPVPIDALFGVLKVRPTGTQGMVDGLAAHFLAPSLTRTVVDRVLQPPLTVPEIDLTIEPAMQTAVADAVRTPLEGEDRLPSGVVVLDARSGQVQALSSAPEEREVVQQFASADSVKAWGKANGGWGPLTEDGASVGPASTDCTRADVACGRLDLRRVSPSLDKDYLRTYVGGDPAFSLPSTTTNRATSRRYNLGSTFKVVLAATYFEAGGSPDDQIPAPSSVVVGGRRIGTKCAGVVNGAISVADALRVSCNTAFIQLARKLDWKKVVAVAERLGFTAVADSSAADETNWPVASHIPRHTDQQSVGTAALGGDVVAGTPFQIATLMGVLANNGTYSEPSLISRTRTADGTQLAVGSTQHRALKPATVAGLRKAMAEVTGEGGTLANVPVPEGVRFMGKSGTHVAREVTTSGTYTTHYAWVSGIVESTTDDRAPISFSVVVEGHGPKVGGSQARHIAAAILQSFAQR